jgi:hypothetical protein
MGLMPDGRTLVIANGGILTHPDMARMKLNLDVMEPNLAYVDAQTGKLLEKRVLPQELHQLSIRHFAIAPDGTVVFGAQHNGPLNERPPLIGFHTRGEEIALRQAPDKIHRSMRNYVGSIAIDDRGQLAVAACPRGNLVTLWDIKTRRFLSHIQLPDGCGAAPTGSKGKFLLTSGMGTVAFYDALNKRIEQIGRSELSRFKWDNHISLL